MTRRLLSASMVMAAAIVASTSTVAAHASTHVGVPVNAMLFKSSKTVNITLKNATSEALTIQVGANSVTVAAGASAKVAATKGDKITRSNGEVVLNSVDGQFNDATITLK
ncbi:MAG: hypothetical protein PW792_02125 [Acidobacteriaceae bacterium]|nr:hypothetical protein [Acidobacteriaceae bacterium]